jgi:DNA-binding LytR/AlgR family response regulator
VALDAARQRVPRRRPLRDAAPALHSSVIREQAVSRRCSEQAGAQFNTDRTHPGRWTVTFSNRPINMFVPTTIVELGALMTDLEADPSVKVVVFQSANPDFFIAHIDVSKAAQRPEVLGLWRDFVLRLSSTPVVSIAKITSLLPVTRVDAANLIRALQQLEVVAKRQAPRIAFKAKGRILFVDLAEIVAGQAEGNYVSLRHRPNPYLLRESLSSMAEKLKPYGFIRIHRSVIVNISAVEEIQPLPTGEYRLRVKGGEQYLVTHTYKDNLRDLAQLWVGSERLCG